ncbi:AfsR/SARP family transcriptional regulator [Dactylosporangium sp. CA-052675]|uniref:AfsR/SARP family transcriptional regulator n=1 Tax=Dactylosporangium sp. CA-052675 TaxID=3239927 RepID=UPI003D93864F
MNEPGAPVLTFGILGPLEVRAGQRRVAVTSARQQALLGAALLRANAVVPTARLVDAIWGDEPPNTAPDLVQTYVSTLRRSIGRPAAACIVTRPPGYLVRVERGALDLHQFERLTEQARLAAAGGDHERATRLLGDALARWRGPALAGLDSPLFRAAAARLERLRLLATERRFESASHLGDPAWMVPELTAFVAEHPGREGARALLTQVLLRLGRPADALRVRQQAGALREPGPGLRAPHGRIS